MRPDAVLVIPLVGSPDETGVFRRLMTYHECAITCSKNEKAPRSAGLQQALERVTRIELAWRAWKARVLPLNYTRSGKRL